MNNEIDVSGSANISWNYPEIGTGKGKPDTLRISIIRVRAIPDLIIAFDGDRDGWSISGSFPNGDDFEIREVGFIPEFDDTEPFSE